jgi:hypothetical protein
MRGRRRLMKMPRKRSEDSIYILSGLEIFLGLGLDLYVRATYMG